MTDMNVSKSAFVAASASDAAGAALPERTWTITELAEEFGLTPRALRFYEEAGLLAPSRKGTARVYGRRDRARLALTVQAKALGFSIADIRDLVDLYDHADGGAVQRRAALAKCHEQVLLLERQRAEIDATLAELARFIATLEQGAP